jgi:hypothetical protein
MSFIWRVAGQSLFESKTIKTRLILCGQFVANYLLLLPHTSHKNAKGHQQHHSQAASEAADQKQDPRELRSASRAHPPGTEAAQKHPGLHPAGSLGPHTDITAKPSSARAPPTARRHCRPRLTHRPAATHRREIRVRGRRARPRAAAKGRCNSPAVTAVPRPPAAQLQIGQARASRRRLGRTGAGGPP